jgi:hypothetical protein
LKETIAGALDMFALLQLLQLFKAALCNNYINFFRASALKKYAHFTVTLIFKRSLLETEISWSIEPEIFFSWGWQDINPYQP